MNRPKESKQAIVVLLFFIVAITIAVTLVFFNAGRAKIIRTPIAFDIESENSAASHATLQFKDLPPPVRGSIFPASINSTLDTNRPSAPQDKVALLQEILSAKDDNDPRLDSEFSSLTVEQKAQLRSFYQGLAPEDLNSRGTTVFLLGRRCSDETDVQFLLSVLREPVCLGASSCQNRQEDLGNSVDDDSGQSVTLVYPQLMALRALGKSFTALERTGLVEKSRSLLEDLKSSSNASIANAANQIKFR